MKILIVDDERHVHEGLKHTVAWDKLGIHELEFAMNGVEAWDRFQQAPPDLLITDMNMPKMNGVELIKRVRQIDQEIPIVILSGYDDFSYTREAIHHNVNRYILKPTVPEDIQREIADVLAEMKQLQHKSKLLTKVHKQIEQNLPFIRQQFLYQMITSGVHNRDLDMKRLSFYQLDPDITSNGVVLLIRLYKTNHRHDISDHEWNLFRFAASNISEEVLRKHGKGMTIPHLEQGLPVLLFGKDEQEVLESAKATAKEIIYSINTYLSLDANIGIGQIYQQTNQYPLSFKESAEALEFCELEGFNQFLYIKDIQSLERAWPQFPAENIRLLAEALVRVDVEDVEAKWLDIERELTRIQNTPISFIQTMCISILSSLLLHIMESEYLMIDSEKMTTMLKEVHSHQSTRELISATRLQIMKVLTMIQTNLSRQNQTPYVNYVKKKVEGCYDQKLSFAQLAKELNISRNYLSNIFKRETGVSFMTYLTEYRIAKAKELLSRKEFMVYEVAEKVGYNDPAYFSRMFKSITGVSPFEYMMSEE